MRMGGNGRLWPDSAVVGIHSARRLSVGELPSRLWSTTGEFDPEPTSQSFCLDAHRADDTAVLVKFFANQDSEIRAAHADRLVIQIGKL